ncbi:MAG: NADH-quinone oxidoreductase subunit L [Eggerthellaceae bacterium]|nr:NADH-quinone oxidoreductase subunit L [Eggerthellaceae bacterium]
MEYIGFLILFPLLAAVLNLIARKDRLRDIITWASSIIIAVASVVFIVVFFKEGLSQGVTLAFDFAFIEPICTFISVLLGAVIIYFGFRYKNVLAIVLGIIQLLGSLIFESTLAPNIQVENAFFIDGLSLLLVGIIGVIGSGICLYALGYMKDFQSHQPSEAKDRRPYFFFLMFVFLSAMFVVVLCNNMVWMFTGWEITTVCSFLLIGYTKTSEAIRNSFRQINMNLVGGIAFLAAMIYCALYIGDLSFTGFISIATSSQLVGQNTFLLVVPLTLFAIAAITKAAQTPFHTWLLGAMVAPTPISALLHSSTMVKAGVFLLVRLAPIFSACSGPIMGAISDTTSIEMPLEVAAFMAIPCYMVVLIGAITFCICSFIAISQNNAKRVLAYSTIANLGLIVACTGVGTDVAVWAACFLILFHAIAKSMLFLCVGTAEHHIGSRDIEEMDLLVERMPKLATCMIFGILCMFIAPFGMLIAKWATLASFVETRHLLLLILLVFGSAATFFFWAKLIGKLSGVAGEPKNIETTVRKSEWFSILLGVILAINSCLWLPLISLYFVEPYIMQIYPRGAGGNELGQSTLFITSILSVVIFIVVFFAVGTSKKKQVDVYLSGISANNKERYFINSMSGQSQAAFRNMYLVKFFSEKRLSLVSTIVCALILTIAVVLVLLIFPNVTTALQVHQKQLYSYLQMLMMSLSGSSAGM